MSTTLMRIAWYVMAVLILFLIALWLKSCLVDLPNLQPPALQRAADVEISEPVITELPPDTVQVIIHDTVRLVDYRVPVTRRDTGNLVAQIDSSTGDTVLICEPFEAAIDTTVANGAHVTGTFAFPPLRLAMLQVECPPDTSRTVRKMAYVDRIITVYKTDPWYIESLRYLGCATIGYAARMMTEPGSDRHPRDALTSAKPSLDVALVQVTF